VREEITIERDRGEFDAERLSSALRELARDLIDERRRVSQLRRELIELRAEMSMAEDRFRRRIERDLHDGVQQRLVVLAIDLGLAREQLAVSEGSALAVLQRVKAEVEDIVDELRALCRGGYPSLMGDRGLPDALRAAASRTPLPTAVDAPDEARYPAEIEAAVYFVCLEALQNAVKHARATHVSITLRAPSFAVTDDGIGFRHRSVKPGSGLRNMRDRLAEIGGSLTITSEPGRGTCISGTVPTN
jgi:signal transduction histidine kinase